MQHHRSGHNTQIHFTHTHTHTQTYIYILEVLIGQILEKYHFNGPNQAHLQAFIYLGCIVAYTLTIFILTGFLWGGIFLRFCLLVLRSSAVPSCQSRRLFGTPLRLPNPAF